MLSAPGVEAGASFHEGRAHSVEQMHTRRVGYGHETWPVLSSLRVGAYEIVQEKSTLKTAALDVDAIVDRMREATGLPSDGRLATYLGITRSAVSNWRRSRKLPIERVVEVHKRARVRLDWPLYGLGERAEVPYDGKERQLEFEAYDEDLLAISLKQIALAERRLTRTHREIWELSTNINLAYIQNMSAYRAMTAGGSLTREQALQALDAAIEHSQRSRQ